MTLRPGAEGICTRSVVPGCAPAGTCTTSRCPFGDRTESCLPSRYSGGTMTLRYEHERSLLETGSATWIRMPGLAAAGAWNMTVVPARRA